MTGWSHGYVADASYTLSYHSGQTPAQLGLVAALNGIDWRPRAEMVVADIGCGRGYTLNVLAAANPGWRCLGLDYNPAHVGEASALADAAALDNVRFLECDLAQMDDAELDALPLLDVAMLHGVWSWVSDAVREGILRLLRRRLKPGGLVYVGYNALPAFGADAALQRVLQLGAALHGRGDSIERIAAAVPLLRQLNATGARHLSETPMLRRLLSEEDAPLDPAYLAHEFLTQHWRPVFHADLSAAMATARLDFIGSASLSENLPELMLDEPSRMMLDRMPDVAARQLLLDLHLQRPFRRDVFMRGARPARPGALDEVELALVSHRRVHGDGASLPPLETPLGRAELAEEMAAPIMAALEEEPQTLGQLRRRPAGRKPGAAELLVMLEGTGRCLPLWNSIRSSETAIRFNRAAASRYAPQGLGSGRYALAVPGLGSGLPCSALELSLAGSPGVQTMQMADAPKLAKDLLGDLTGEAASAAETAILQVLRERLPIWRSLAAV
jgi:SAM-dependent methyltransferase